MRGTVPVRKIWSILVFGCLRRWTTVRCVSVRFEQKSGQTIYVSATPGKYEREYSQRVVEQIIRPTGLVGPEVEVRPVQGQIDDLLEEIRIRVEKISGYW